MVKKRNVLSYSKLQEVLELPNLLEIQLDSFEWFKKEGLKELFEEIFPITDFTGTLSLEFISYEWGEPLFTVDECRDKDMSYAAPLRVKLRLVNKETGEIKEQNVLLGDFPIMTESGTFIINGAERCVVNQLMRAAGIYYSEKLIRGEGKQYSCRIIPKRGSWIEAELEPTKTIYIRVEKSRRIPATMLLRALGYATNQEIIKLFAEKEKLDKVSYKKLLNNMVAAELYDEKTQKVIAKEGDIINEELAKLIELRMKDKEIEIYKIPEAILKTLEQDDTKTVEDAQLEVYRKMRPTEPPSIEAARALIHHAFFDERRYELGTVGRYKLNKKFDRPTDEQSLNVTILTKQDFIDMIAYLIKLEQGIGEVDDIDHLGNRRVKALGEQLQAQLRSGLLRTEKIAKERMMIQDKETILPQSLINIRPIVSALNEFFGTSQLSQYLDQTNPLAETTHKRRLSCLGPGGLTREQAGVEVRDVHHSHYGRICPIETPEGQNIGLITSLSTYARVNKLGFIETPYRKVVDGKVTDEIVYLTADEEDKYIIAQANAPLNEDNTLAADKIMCRHKKHHILAAPKEVSFIDVSPKQIVSVSASLVPFLEHNDANRALMGSNMQRQAVPLVTTEEVLVATGVEKKIAADSGAVVRATTDGVVEKVSATEIVIRENEKKAKVYKLRKFQKSNQNTCINQIPLVRIGDKVKKGDVIADGPCTYNGILALGKNVLVAFMPWHGYNFEDAIIISERLVKDDTFTSIHIEEYTTEARDTKLGSEEITRDTPNVAEDMLKDLDEKGIIRCGAEVKAEDILVGKITPKGETELTPEERLLRAIFGEKAREMADTSLRVPHGGRGKVIDVKLFERDKGDELPVGVNQLVRCYVAQTRKIAEGDKVAGRHGNKGIVSRILAEEDMPYLPDGTPIDIILNPLGVPSRMNIGQILEAHIGWCAHNLGVSIVSPVFDGPKEKDIAELLAITKFIREGKVEVYNAKNDKKIGYFKIEDVKDEERIKVLGNCDKIASLLKKAKIGLYDTQDNLICRLDYSEVPSNEIIESWVKGDEFWQLPAIRKGKSTELSHDEIEELFNNLLFKETGKTILYDGKTGEPFENEVTVGYMYMMKLNHLVEDKIHARSTGPYALITQQPLGGKAQFGGQRFGEMEVWALEAYGASNILQELLTVKSDDVQGRVKTYEAIIKGENVLEVALPESFKVLVKELQSLGIDVKLIQEGKGYVDVKDILEKEVTTVSKELERELM